jgi:hypothetical protein
MIQLRVQYCEHAGPVKNLRADPLERSGGATDCQRAGRQGHRLRVQRSPWPRLTDSRRRPWLLTLIRTRRLPSDSLRPLRLIVKRNGPALTVLRPRMPTASMVLTGPTAPMRPRLAAGRCSDRSPGLSWRWDTQHRRPSSLGTGWRDAFSCWPGSGRAQHRKAAASPPWLISAGEWSRKHSEHPDTGMADVVGWT